MINRPFDQIDRDDLAALAAMGVSERRDLEFKRDLPTKAPDDVHEFLADVTSLANAQGGDLIYGMTAIEGVATELSGLAVASQDGALLRFENMLRTSIDPRLTGVRMEWIPITGDRGAILLRVPASLAAPHRVRYHKSGLFYGRNSRGKYEMDAHELRTAFTQSEQLPHRFRQLHAEAVAAAAGRDMPVLLRAEPAAVVSTIPLGYFRELRDLPVTPEMALLPPEVSGINAILTLEGVLMHTALGEDNAVRSYAVTHRGGRTDAAWTVGGVREVSGEAHRWIWPHRYEKGLLDATRSTTAKFQPLGVEGPWVVLVTIIGARGYQLILGDGYASQPGYRDNANLPELIVEHINEDSLLPLLRSFWLLFGLNRPEGRAI